MQLVVVVLLVSAVGTAVYFWRQSKYLGDQLIYALSVARESKEEAMAMRLLQDQLFKVLPEGILMLDQHRQIVMCSQAAEKMIGENTIGKTIMAATRHYELDELITEIPDQPHELTERRIDLNERSIRAQAARIKTEEGLLTILILNDETELLRLARARRDMVANISHELRTPISNISMLAETLMGSGLGKKARKMVKDIRRQTAHLTQLIEEMRDLSQIESGHMPIKMEPIPLQEVVDVSVEALAALAEDKKQTLEVDISEETMVLVDAMRIERVLRNILHNAIKFTPEKGKIRVAQSKRGEDVTVSISDTGPGIAPENLSRIFERFFQEDSARRDGTGLGLAIARHIILAHGGEIWVESPLGEGACFYFTLPADSDDGKEIN